MNPDPTATVATTARLIIRRIGPGDRAALLAVYGDADAMRWVGDGSALGAAECERWIEITRENYRSRGYGMFAIALAPDGPVIGFCGLVHPHDQPEPELKYALRREYWGQGFASEAAAGLLRYGVEGLGLSGIIATVAPANAASQRVLRKCGMREIEPRRNADGTTDRVFLLARP